MKKLFPFIILLLPTVLFSQTLREFDLQEMNEQQIPVFIDHPNDAAFIFYTAISGFTIESSTGGVVSTQSDGSKFTAFLKPERQILTLKAPGFIEKKLPVENLSSKQAKFYRLNGREDSYQPESGSAKITTDPAGCLLLITGFPEFREKTPYEMMNYEAKKYRINLTKPDYFPLDTLIEIRAGIRQNLVFRLKSKFGTLSIKASAKVTVKISGQDELSLGSTFVAKKLPAGTYTLEVNDPAFEPIKMEVTLESGETELLDLSLVKKSGYLQISHPEKFSFTANGVSYSKETDPQLVEFQEGTYKAVIKRSGFKQVEFGFVIKKGSVITWTPDFTPETAIVKIVSLPEGADVTLIRNGKEKFLGFTPLDEKIAVGEVEFLLKKEGFNEYRFKEKLEEGKPFSKKVNLANPEETTIVKLESEPSGATVILNRGNEKVLLGQTPLEAQIAIGDVEFLIKKEGFKDFPLKVKLEDGIVFNRKLNLTAVLSVQYGKFTDNNGNEYKTVILGDQEWMAENLRTTKYNDGTSIINISGNGFWISAAVGAYCAYNNSESNASTYGYLYNWYAVSSGKLAPAGEGWRVPSDADWVNLSSILGGDEQAGVKLMSTAGWPAGKGGTDEVGFKSLPGGFRFFQDGTFGKLGTFGYWWSSTNSSQNAWSRELGSDSRKFKEDYYPKKNGFSVRLVRNRSYLTDGSILGEESKINTVNTTVEKNIVMSDGASGSLSYNGDVYKTVVIGEQEWTVENLRTTKYNTGKPITKITDNSEWSKRTSGAFCAYDNNESNVVNYGYLYNWYAVKNGKLAPKTGGWRVPTDADWTKLTDFVGRAAGIILKAKSGWHDSRNGINDYGFSALPGGGRDEFGVFGNLSSYGVWWSSTADGTYAWYRYMSYDSASVVRASRDQRVGYSVRLVRDK